MSKHTPRNAGFTLIELLVVVSVIGILISVLLPALQSARGSAQKMVGASTQRQLALGQIAYGYEKDNWYAGINSPGNRFATEAVLPFNGGTFQAPGRHQGDTTATTPVQNYDWISPTVGNDQEFSANRARRTAQIFNYLADPKAGTPNIVYTGSNGSDLADFRDVAREIGYNQISYLSPVYMHWIAQGVSARHVRVGVGATQLTSPSNAISPIVRTPDSFRPRFDRIKGSSYKVLVTDGTRYLTRAAEGGFLDFDASPNATSFGSFTANTPLFAGATAWLRPQAGGSEYTGADNLSIRHDGNTTANVSFFDGSGGSLTRDEIYGDPKYWHPRGGVFQGGNTTEEVLQNIEVGDKVN